LSRQGWLPVVVHFVLGCCDLGFGDLRMQAIVVKSVVVSNPQGMHARPAHLVAQAAAKFVCDIHICRDTEWVDAKSILELLMLAASQGSTLQVRASGQDAQAAVDAICNVIGSGFGENEASPS
jgi:phosphocarrier protein HPr